MDPTKCVLIVEDNEDNRNIFKTILEYTGFRVVEAEDGESGLARFEEEPPDLVVLDIALPGIDGWEVARRIRGESDPGETPILVVTADESEEAGSRAEELGCVDRLTKPISPMRLAREVEKYIGPGRATDGEGNGKPPAE